jgi:hypothetical protein
MKLLQTITFSIFWLFLFIPLTYAWWNDSWSYRLLLNITETAGIDRIFEPVEVQLISDLTKLQNCSKEIRVVEGNKEILSQVYNERINNSTISCNVVFLANISAYSSKIYYIYYGNPSAQVPDYSIDTDLIIKNSSYVENSYFIWNYFGNTGHMNDFLLTIKEGTNTDIADGPWDVWQFCSFEYRKNIAKELLFFGPVVGKVKYKIIGDGCENFDLYFTFYAHNRKIKFFLNHTPTWGQNYTIYLSQNFLRDSDVYLLELKDGNKTLPYTEYPNSIKYDFSVVGNYTGMVVRQKSKTDRNDVLGIVSDFKTNFLYVAPEYDKWHPTRDTLAWNNTDMINIYYIFLNSTNSWERIYLEAKKLGNPLKIYIISEEAQFLINFSYPQFIFVENIFPLLLNVSYHNSLLTNLTQSNFKLFLNNEEIEIINSTKYDEINYLIFARANTSTLGRSNLKILVTFNNLIGSASSPIFIKTPIKQKILFITNQDWKNIYSLAPLKKPILITNEINEKILHFINLYQPEQIFILGNIAGNINHPEVYKISSYLDIPKLFFAEEKGVYAGNSEDRKNHIMLASQIAALLNKPLVFTDEDADEEFNFSSKTVDEIKEIYLQKLKEKNKNTNYLIVAEEGDLIAPIVSAQKAGFILDLSPQTIEPSLVMKNINETVELLNKNGLFVNNSQYLFNGAFILLSKNIPAITKEDPVEKQKYFGIIGFDDPEDGENFTTYLEYGDLNNDTYLDVAVGKLPDDEEIASLMLARTLLQDSKKALVASEYLHTAWPIILLYAGGGMWQGRSVAKILEKQGYNVTRFVEHRSDPVELFSDLTSLDSWLNFLNETNSIVKKIEILLGKTVGSVAYKAILLLKGLNYAEKFLEMYLQYDWSTFGPNLDKAIKALQNVNWTNWNNTKEEAIKFLINLLWPYPWKDISNKTSLKQELPNHSTIYYIGIGNGSKWILPNEIPKDRGFLDWKEFLMNRYNGSNNFESEELPAINARIVWDNSNFGGIGKMKDSFLEKGAASLIGASALNYNQFSAEIDSRFFKKGWTIGSSLIDAINDFRDDWLTWDPLNILKPGIKAKTLREFILWGDPSLTKDPIIEQEKYVSNITCNNGICEQNVTIPVAYELINTTNETTIFVDTDDYLLELFKPIIPLVEFEYYLPFSTEIISTNVTFETVNFTNITLPRFELLQYGINYTNETKSTEWYPENISRIEISNTADGRTRIKLIHAALMYNESSGSAIVFPKISLNLRYITPLEFSIFTRNISLGETQRLEVKIWSNISDNATLYLQFSNSTTIENFAINYTLNASFSILHFNYTPKTIGAYSVKAVLVKHDPLTVGPRESTFYVSDTNPPKLFIHEYLNRSTFKPGDELNLKVEVIEDDVIRGDCQIYVGQKLLGNISYSQGWCNGSVTLAQDSEGEKVINVTISDRSGNVGYNDSYTLILEIPKAKEIPTGFVALAPIAKKNETNITTLEKQAFPPVEEVKKEEKIKAICGNGICEEGENQENCPIDCMPKIEKKEIPKQTGLTGFFVLVASNLPLIFLAVAIVVTIILVLKIKAF